MQCDDLLISIFNSKDIPLIDSCAKVEVFQISDPCKKMASLFGSTYQCKIWRQLNIRALYIHASWMDGWCRMCMYISVYACNYLYSYVWVYVFRFCLMCVRCSFGIQFSIIVSNLHVIISSISFRLISPLCSIWTSLQMLFFFQF